jgi:hypothetical protein
MTAILSPELSANRRELARKIRDKKFDITESGIYMPSFGFIGGVMETTVNHQDPMISANLLPTEGLNHLLNVLLGGTTPVSPWYVGLFSANVTPLATLTAANWVANQTEYTGYSEANRVTYVEAAAAAGVVSNTASRAEFTIGGTITIYGGALVSAQAKSATTGTLLACALFSAGRAVVLGDTLQVLYTITATSS